MRRAAIAALGGLAGLAMSALPGTVVRGTVAVAADSTPGSTGTSAAPSYLPAGTPIEGAENPVGGPPLPGPGLYLDSLQRGSTSAGTAGSSKYYTVELHKGETPWFSATMIVPPGYSNAESGAVDLTVQDLQPDEFGCSWSAPSNFQQTTGHTVTPLSVALHTPMVGGPNWPAACPRNGGTFVVNVSRSGTLFPNSAMPVEIGFRIEPPAQNTELPPPAHAASPLRAQRNGRPAQRTTAGYSFNNAPLIRPGTYSDSIVTGQTRYFRIHLDWGQRFTYLINSTHVPGIDTFSLTAQTTIFTPMRAQVQQAGGISYETGFGGQDAGALSGTTLAAVRYTNRRSADDNVQPYAIAGDYVLALTLGYSDSEKLTRIPYTLVVDVSGRVEPGPSYAASALPAQPSASAPVVAGPADTGGISVWALAGIAAVVALALLLIGLVALRRGAHSGPPHNGGLPTTAGPVRGNGAMPHDGPPNADWPPSAVPPGPPPR